MGIEERRRNRLREPLMLFGLTLSLALEGSNCAATRQVYTSTERPAVATEQETNPDTKDTKDVLAIIAQSGSTNTRGYRVVIYNDGSVMAEIAGTTVAGRVEPSHSQQFPAGTIDTKTLHRVLAEVGDVGRIPTGGCAKSVSFGTRTQITYQGKTSGDLQCIRRQPSEGTQPEGNQAQGKSALLQAAQDLGRFVQTTLAQLKIDNRRIRVNQ